MATPDHTADAARNSTTTSDANSLIDFQNMVQLFSRDRVDHFARSPLGIHTLRGHIRELDRRIEAEALSGATEELPEEVERDPLFRELVTQRSRADIVASMLAEDGEVRFPTMALEAPRVCRRPQLLREWSHDEENSAL